MLRGTLIALAAVALLFTAAACGDDGNGRENGTDNEASAETYFNDLNAALLEVQTAAIPDPVFPPDATLDQRKAALGASSVERNANLTTFIGRLEALRPPENTIRLHGLYVAAANQLREAFTSYDAGVLGANSIEAFDDAYLRSGPVIDAGSALSDLCVDMEDAAGEHGITLDLRCTG